MDLKGTIPENVSIDKIETEVQYIIDRVHELEAIIESCYEKMGEDSRNIDLPDLIHTQRRLLLQKEIEIQELKNQISSQIRKMRVTVDKAKKAQEANLKNAEEKEELEKSLDTLKVKIHKLQEERQKMAMKMAFDGNASIGPATSTAPSSPRSKSSR
jgi:seryl-tRNA synthetase